MRQWRPRPPSPSLESRLCSHRPDWGATEQTATRWMAWYAPLSALGLAIVLLLPGMNEPLTHGLVSAGTTNLTMAGMALSNQAAASLLVSHDAMSQNTVWPSGFEATNLSFGPRIYVSDGVSSIDSGLK